MKNIIVEPKGTSNGSYFIVLQMYPHVILASLRLGYMKSMTESKFLKDYSYVRVATGQEVRTMWRDE